MNREETLPAVTGALSRAVYHAKRASAEVLKSLETIGQIAIARGDKANGLTEILNIFSQQTLDMNKWSFIGQNRESVGTIFRIMDRTWGKVQNLLYSLSASEFKLLTTDFKPGYTKAMVRDWKSITPKQAGGASNGAAAQQGPGQDGGGEPEGPNQDASVASQTPGDSAVSGADSIPDPAAAGGAGDP